MVTPPRRPERAATAPAELGHVRVLNHLRHKNSCHGPGLGADPAGGSTGRFESFRKACRARNTVIVSDSKHTQLHALESWEIGEHMATGSEGNSNAVNSLA